MDLCERNIRMYFKLWLCISLGVVGLGFSCPALCCPSAFTKNKEKKTFVSKEVFETKIVEEMGILSQPQWRKAREENPELKNLYPYWPERVYPNFKWPGERNFVSEKVFIKEMEERGIHSQKQWAKAREENPDLKNRYPSLPEKTYPHFKWLGERNFVSEEVFTKKIVEEMGILSQRQWKKARKENPELKNHYPSKPEKIYPHFKWTGKKTFVSEEVFTKEIVEEMGILSQTEWKKARQKNPELKSRYPYWPEKIYSNFKWPGEKNFVSEEVFIKKIEEEGIYSQRQWIKARKENPELKLYPSRPEKIYLNFKWIGERNIVQKNYLINGFVSKENFVQHVVDIMGVTSQPEWVQLRIEHLEFQKHYPLWPEKVYKDFLWFVWK